MHRPPEGKDDVSLRLVCATLGIWVGVDERLKGRKLYPHRNNFSLGVGDGGAFFADLHIFFWPASSSLRELLKLRLHTFTMRPLTEVCSWVWIYARRVLTVLLDRDKNPLREAGRVLRQRHPGPDHRWLRRRPSRLSRPGLARLLCARIPRQSRYLRQARQPALARHLPRQIHQDWKVQTAYHSAERHRTACAVQGVGESKWRNAVSVWRQRVEGACGKVERGLPRAPGSYSLVNDRHAIGEHSKDYKQENSRLTSG